MAETIDEPLKYKNVYASLIVVLILVFLAVFFRENILYYYNPELKAKAFEVPKDRRLNDWNLSHVDSATKLAMSGDIVAINESGELSTSFRSMNKRNILYAYLGIIMIENNTPFVYYAAANKSNPNQALQRDSLKHYIYPDHVLNFGIYRLEMKKRDIDKLKGVVTRAYKVGLPFDPVFNLESDSAMYNTEFVYKMFQSVLPDSASGFTTSDLMGKTYIACDDIVLSEKIKMICKIKYSR